MSSYLKREYFFDVHPPIGRLLIALAGWILKLDPSFDYKTGESFPPNYNYCSLRIYHTIFSGLSSPAAYLSVRNLGLPKLLSLIAGLFIALGNVYLAYIHTLSTCTLHMSLHYKNN